MTWRNLLALGGTALLVGVLLAIALLASREERRGRPVANVFTRPETAYWGIGIGLLIMVLGALVPDSENVRTLMLSVGASVLGGGVMTALSL
jgi:hypothetical protein